MSNKTKYRPMIPDIILDALNSDPEDFTDEELGYWTRYLAAVFFGREPPPLPEGTNRALAHAISREIEDRQAYIDEVSEARRQAAAASHHARNSKRLQNEFCRQIECNVKDNENETEYKENSKQKDNVKTQTTRPRTREDRQTALEAEYYRAQDKISGAALDESSDPVQTALEVFGLPDNARERRDFERELDRAGRDGFFIRLHETFAAAAKGGERATPDAFLANLADEPPAETGNPEFAAAIRAARTNLQTWCNTH